MSPLFCVQKRWNWGFLISFILLVIIPAYQGLTLQDYDLVVANGNNLMLFRSSVNESLNIPVIKAEKNQKIVSVVSDPKHDLVYFSIVRKNSSSIALYNVIKNRTNEIYTSSKGSIGSLTFNQDYLYWCNEFNKTVLRLGVPEMGISNQSHTIPLVNSPEVVFVDKNASFDSLAIHPLNGTIFYTKWSRGNESKILSYDQVTKTAKVLVENVYQPQGLFTSPTHLYWIDNPPGIYYNIERLSLTDSQEPEKRELIHRGQHQHPFAISAANCSRKMFWSDVMNKVLWEFDLKDKSLKLLTYYKGSVPYGITLTKQDSICKDEPQHPEGGLDMVNLSTNTITTVSGDEEGHQAYAKLPANVKTKITTSSILKPTGSVSTNTAKVINAHWCSFIEKTHCENGASCLKLDNQINCLCQPGFAGPTCAQIIGTAPLASRSIDSYLSLSSWSSNPPFFLSCTVFSIVVILLLVTILVLILKVRRLDQKPRIRRRLVVSHRSDVENNSSGSSVCEMIDIENCCNMNVCETPCYERVTGAGSTVVSAGAKRSRKSSVKEDKKCLLSS